MVLKFRAPAAVPKDLGLTPSTHKVTICNPRSRESDALFSHQCGTQAYIQVKHPYTEIKIKKNNLISFYFSDCLQLFVIKNHEKA